MRFFMTDRQMMDYAEAYRKRNDAWEESHARLELIRKVQELRDIIGVARLAERIMFSRGFDASSAVEEAKLYHDKIAELVPR